jgi:hypothetical protein
VSRLYLKAKAEGIPMTRLASRLIERALGPNEPSDIPVAKHNNAKTGAE